MVLCIFQRVIEQSQQDHSPGATNVGRVALQIGALAFVRRFGSTLNCHVHFHACVVDVVFEEALDFSVVGIRQRQLLARSSGRFQALS